MDQSINLGLETGRNSSLMNVSRASPESFKNGLFQVGHLTKCLFSSIIQSYPTLSDPMDCSLPGSSIHGIFQARVLEWVAISFSNAWKWKVKGKSLSRVWLLATPWTAAYQASLPMGFSKQEYWSGVPFLKRIKRCVRASKDVWGPVCKSQA